MHASVDCNDLQKRFRNSVISSHHTLPSTIPVRETPDQLLNAFGEVSVDQGSGKSLLGGSLGRLNAASPVSSFQLSHFSGEFLATRCSQLDDDNGVTCTVGPSLAGLLYKWVNYGKGWKPRWFILQEGVLSYYKIHGPDKIDLNRESLKGLKVVGDASRRLVRKRKNANTDNRKPRKIFGELHLKVSSVRGSKSDHRKFYIFTGTKTLHLQTETREDQITWLKALQTAKDLFPKRLTISDIVLPFEEIVVSTERLRNCLYEEGLSSESISSCESIMLSEFSQLQGRLKSMQCACKFLLERLRQLEVEKVELETTVVDKSQNPGIEAEGFKGPETVKDCEGSGTESDQCLAKKGGMEPHSEEEKQDMFYDTRESFSGSYWRECFVNSVGDLSDTENVSIDGFQMDANGTIWDMQMIGLSYPYVKRRKRLHEPKEKEKGASLWSLIKDSIGKDLTRVCLPVYFNEPLSSLQKCFEDLEYSYLLDRAHEWGKKVSHHPMIVACHCEGRGWKLWGDSTFKSKFWGQSIQLDPVGILTLEFDDGEVFQWSKVTTAVYNLILGKLYCDHYG
eukprot:c27954_g1_i2 orf=166-1860(+)